MRIGRSIRVYLDAAPVPYGFTRLAILSLILGSLVYSPGRAQVWYDTFSDGNHSDGDPVRWEVNPLGQLPGSYDSSSGDFVFSTDPNRADELMLSYVNSVDYFATGSARAQTYLQGSGGATGEGNTGVLLFYDRRTISGYVGAIDASGTLYLVVSQSGTITRQEEFELGTDGHDSHILQLDHDGTNVSLTAWRPGDVQPTTPQLTFSDTTFTSGPAGVVFLEDAENDIAVFEWAMSHAFALRDGDIDNDNIITPEDIDQLYTKFGSDNPFFDLNKDGEVSLPDVDFLVRDVLNTDYGDVNLDGRIDATDFDLFGPGLYTGGNGWRLGDFNGDHTTDGRDFNIWYSNRTGLAAGAAVVPEPYSVTIALCSVWVGLLRRRSTGKCR